MTAVEVAIVVGAFVGQAVAVYVVGSRKGRRKAIIEGAPNVFGESFLRRAEAHFKTGHDHAQMLQAHELKIVSIIATIGRIEAQYTLYQASSMLELKEIRSLISDIREELAGLKGMLGRRVGDAP